MKPDSAPRLVDWMNASEVAEELGISRTTVNQMVHAGEFKTLHISGVVGQKPQFMIKRKEVETLKETREFPRRRAADE